MGVAHAADPVDRGGLIWAIGGAIRLLSPWPTGQAFAWQHIHRRFASVPGVSSMVGVGIRLAWLRSGS
jgi:hypothetical protein